MKKIGRANYYFGVTEEKYKQTGAFNPIIGMDNEFFVDPLLLKKTSIPEFKDGLENVRNYFRQIIVLLKTGNSRAEKIALSKLIIPEIKGVSIGYGSSDDGSAIGPKLAAQILATAKELLEIGINEPEIFEIMGVFEENFGPDRLSDAIIFINKNNFYRYSERIAKELSIKDVFVIKEYAETFNLPKHPLNNKQFIFIPEELLSDLPVAHSYEDISFVATYNAGLRDKFNKFLRPCFYKNKNPKKSEFRDYIFKDKERLITLVNLYSLANSKSYDFINDPEGLCHWLEKAEDIVNQNPLDIDTPNNSSELNNIVEFILDFFKNFVEKKGGWRILYNDKGLVLNEKHARLIFYCISLLYLQNKNIDISPESNAGSGPVDFKLSTGKEKIIVEVKLSSGHVFQGYTKQTRIYEESEDAVASYFLVLRVNNSKGPIDEILKIEESEEEMKKKHPNIFIIDGTKKKSASNA